MILFKAADQQYEATVLNKVLTESVKQLPRHPSQIGNYNVLVPLPDSVSNNKNLYYKPSKLDQNIRSLQ